MFGLIVRKELKEIVGTPRFAATFLIVSLLILLAFYLGARGYQVGMAQYEAAVAENLRQMEGQTDWLRIEPSIFMPPTPLGSLVTGISNDVGRNIQVIGMGSLRASGSRYNEDPILAMFRFLDLEFIFQIVLSLFAILFAYDLISGEKERGTLRLALSSAVPRDTWILGKLTGAFLGLTVPLLVPILLGCLLLLAMGIPMAGDEWLRLGFLVLVGMLYVGTFLGFSLLVSSLTHRSSTSFLILLVVWILAVLVIPRGAVLMAARAVEVPSVDEILSQRARLRSQLWQEDLAAVKNFFEQGGEIPEDPQAQQQRLASFNQFFQELSEERTRKLEELDARLGEERLNRQNVQERLALGLARLSPAAAFSIAAFQLAGTALDLPRDYLDQARAYQEVFARFQKEKTGGQSSSGIMVKVRFGDDEPEEEVVIDPREMPVFDFRPPPVHRILQNAVLDLGLLTIFNVLFFAGGFVAFLRYDVR